MPEEVPTNLPPSNSVPPMDPVVPMPSDNNPPVVPPQPVTPPPVHQPEPSGPSPDLLSISSDNKAEKPKGGNKLLLIIAIVIFVFISFVGGFLLRDKVNLGGAFASPSPQGASGKPLVIGAIVPLTGDSASYGVALQQAAFLAQREINASGGVGGRQLEILWENGRCEGEDARLAAVKLVEEKKVDMLIGGVCSSEFLKSAPLAQSHKIISWSPAATSTQISSLGKYIFRTAPSDSAAGKVAAQYASSKWGAKKAAVVVENKEYPLSLRNVFASEFASLGGEIVSSEVFESGITDFSTYANKVKAAEVDVVYILPQSSTPGVLLVKALKDAGVTAKILTAEVLLIRDAVAESGQILEGVTGIEVLVDENRPQTKKFLELYKKEYNLDPTYPGFMSGIYDIVYLFKEGYEKAGADPDQMSQYYYDLVDWQGAVGVLNFDQNGDPTLAYSIRLLTGGIAQQVDIFTPKTGE